MPIPNSLQRNVTKAVLRSAKGQDFTFEYNPTEISISHNAEGLADPVGKDSAEDARSIVSSIATRGSTRLVMSALTFAGENIQDKIGLLVAWVTAETITRPDGTSERGKRERLRFQWGSRGTGFDYEVELMRFECMYTRFAHNGRPTRAEVRNLTLHVLSHTGDTATPADRGGLALPASAIGSGPAGLPPGMKHSHNADPTRTLLKERSR